jgi:hypothetical protein
VAEHWEALKNRRLPDIARALRVSVKEIQDAVDHIAT